MPAVGSSGRVSVTAAPRWEAIGGRGRSVGSSRTSGAGEPLGPVGELLPDHRFWGRQVSRERRAARSRSRRIAPAAGRTLVSGLLRAGRVGGDDVGQQRRHRLTVGGDVVRDRGEHIALTITKQPEPNGPVPCQINGTRSAARTRSRPPKSTTCQSSSTGHRLRRGDQLVGRTVDIGERGRRTSCRKVHPRSPPAAHRRRARRAHHGRDVVGGRLGVEPAQEPHALLRERQRNPLGPRNDRGHLRQRRRMSGDRRDEFPHRRGLEHITQGSPPPRAPRTPARPGGRQRVAADVEERFGDRHPVDAQDLGGCRDGNLSAALSGAMYSAASITGSGRAALSSLPTGVSGSESSTVIDAVAPCAPEAVRRQTVSPRQCRYRRRCRHGPRQAPAPGLSADTDDDGRMQIGMLVEDCLDLAEFDRPRSLTWSSLRPEYSMTGAPDSSSCHRTTSPVRYIRSPVPLCGWRRTIGRRSGPVEVAARREPGRRQK